MPSFRDKAVIVTGGARGIGRAIVEAFAQAGAKVGIGHSGRSEAEAAEIIRSVGGNRAISLPGDVADARSAVQIVEKTMSAFGRIDILVNNAGICPFTDVLDLTVEEFDRVQAVNTRSIFLMSQQCARRMIAAGTGGAIVNVTSISGERFTNPQQLAYCTSKAAANMLTRGLAVTLAPYRIRVNAVLPGTIPTDINADVLAGPGVREGIIQATPLRCLGDTRDVAAAVLFLAGDDAKWITGALMVVDGGFIA